MKNSVASPSQAHAIGIPLQFLNGADIITKRGYWKQINADIIPRYFLSILPKLRQKLA